VVESSTRRVLLVDDDAELLALFGRQFVRAGYEVTVCRSAGEALARLGDHAFSWTGAVVDLNLPDLQGLELLQRILADFPDLGIVITSGSPFAPAGLPASRPTQFRFLQKPFRPSALVEAMAAVSRA
jgi:two-component system C4-dicarboxylate transport response regulator DctD